MQERQLISSGTKWETGIGYSRAVRVGNVVSVAGTTAVNELGEIVGQNAYEQTRFIIQKIEKALQAAGASLANVTRTRIYLINIADWQEAGRAHGEFFADIRPASTMLAVSAFVAEGLLVEIEADAVV